MSFSPQNEEKTCPECSHPMENHKDSDCETDCQDCLIEKGERLYDASKDSFNWPAMQKYRTGNVPQSFSTTKERSDFLVSELRHSIVSDFHRLSAEIGRKEAIAFLKKSIISLPF